MLSPSSGNRQLPTLLTDLLGKLDSLPAEQRQAITAELDSLRACLADEITAGEVQSLLQTIFTFDPGGMEVITFPDLVYQMVNNAYRAMAPDPNVNLLGKSMDEIWPAEVTSRARGFIEQVMATGQPNSRTYPLTLADGQMHWFVVHVIPLQWRGQPAVLCVHWETTELEKNRGALAQSEARFRDVLEHSLDVVYRRDLIADRYDYMSPVIEQMLGYTPKEMDAMDHADVICCIHPDDQAGVDAGIKQASQTGRAQLEYRFRAKDGEYHWMADYITVQKDAEGQPRYRVGVLRDITERRQAEEVLRQKELILRENMQALRMSETEQEIHHRLLEHRERERQEIARDIHDGPIQSMLGVLFTLQMAKEAITYPDALSVLDQTAMDLKNAIQELREVVNELRPPSIIRYGLSRAIQIHSEDIRARFPELIMDLDLVEDEQLLPEDVCLALYRIYQEAINNVLRHAHASQVSVRYYPFRRNMVLQIKDNGQGFSLPPDPVELTRRNHYGVAGMRERVDAIGGVLDLTSQPGQGTTLTVSVPIDRGN